jgi:MFS transporter, PPP family, 3-phenylpropionic acid transporter
MPTPYWKLSSFYFFYFASIGAFVPYWGLYLRGEGFTPGQIGELMAIIMATKIVAPNVWGWLADRSGQRTRIIRLAALLALVAFSGMTLYTGYWWIAAIMAAFSFFWNAALPQYEALTMNRLGGRTHRYARIRLWGSVGFIASVALLGPLFERVDVAILPWIVLFMLVALWVSTLTVSDDPVPSHGHHTRLSLAATLRRPEVAALLIACFMMQASHGPYYAFFTIYLEDHGYSRTMAGQLWALGVLAEVAVFLMMHRWLPYFGAWRLLLVAIGVTAVRWWLLASLPEALPVMLLTQVMHAASYGLYHAAAISLIHEFFPGRLQGRGQALYSSLSFGLGGALGSLASGYVWGGIGPAWVYFMASGLATAGLVAAWIGMRSAQGGRPHSG